MAVRNFLSGVESTQHFQAAVNSGARHMLMSYLYVTKQPGNILAARKKQHPQLRFMIDSGAHTLQVSMGKDPYKNWKLPDFEKYVRGYVAWLRANKQHIFAAVELDIAYCLNVATGRKAEDPYGDFVVDEWRQKLFRPLEDEGMSIIYVWHPAQGHAGWETMCANLAYVGLPGEMSKQEDFNTFMSVAKRYTTKVHGFAATKQSDFRDWPWYSIDSTTWKAGEIYGTLPVWDEKQQKLRFLAKSDNRGAYRQVFLDWGLKADAIINDTDYQEVTKASLCSMTAMEMFYSERYKNRRFYYDHRLPPPPRIRLAFPTAQKIQEAWKLFNPSEVFPQHANITNPGQLQQLLGAISAVQYRRLNTCSPLGKAFLTTYFPTQMTAQIPDLGVLSKELAMHIAPANEPIKQRETEQDYADSANPPRPRDAKDIPILIVEDEVIPEWLLQEHEDRV